MLITLIGMSGSGKSHWSKELEHHCGFVRICCDDLIEQQLEPQLKEYGFQGIEDVSKWMGQPQDPEFSNRQLQYLTIERQVMLQILATLPEAKSTAKKTIIDTSGSVIHAGKDIMQSLKQHTTIVQLETPSYAMDEMLEQFLEDPKPVIWGQLYRQQPGETEHEALQRCYPDLLLLREQRYGHWADTSLRYQQLREDSLSTEDFLKLVATA